MRIFQCIVILTLVIIIPLQFSNGDQKRLPDLTIKAASKQFSEVINDGIHSWKIITDGNTQIATESIIIEVLDGISVNPTLSVKDSIDFSSLKAIVNSIVTAEMTDKEKALALWRFVMNNAYQGPWGTSLDGLEQINVYGYGYCGTFAAVLEPLWWAAGLKARHVNIGNHAATEVYYDNDWHYIDAHRRCYFLEKDNETIASLDDLNLEPGLWDMKRQKKSDKQGKKKYYYMTMHPQGNGRSPEYSRHFTMAKGDILTLTFHKNKKWCLSRGTEGSDKPAPEPDIYANGTFRFKRDLSDSKYRSIGLISSINIDMKDISTGYMHPLEAGKEASLVYRIRVPYFIPSASVSGVFIKKNPEDMVEIDFSTDNGTSWFTLWTAQNTGRIEAKAVTERTQEITTEKPWKYSYMIRIRMKAKTSPLDVGVFYLESLADIVYNPKSLPTLKKGENIINFRDDGNLPRSVKVTYSWKENLPITLSEDRPIEGQIVKLQAKIMNIGHVKAEKVPVVFYHGNPETGGIEIGKNVIASISPGESVTTEIKWKATRLNLKSSEKAEGAPIYVKIDPDNKILELDKSNNIYVRIFKVLNSPEVSIPSSSFIIFEKNKDRPNIISVKATVRNFSNSSNYGHYLNDHSEAKNIIVRFFDGKPNIGNQIGNDQIIERLLPLEHKTVRVDWNISGLSGRHDIYVQVSTPENVVEAIGSRTTKEQYVSINLDACPVKASEKVSLIK